MKTLRLVALSSIGILVSSSAFLGACSDDDGVTDQPGVDGGGTDARTDSNVPPGDDGGTDGDTPEPDGGNDGGTDAGNITVPDFVSAVADALCTSMAKCCFGSTPPDGGAVDGGTYDPAVCLDLSAKFGFESSNRDVPYSATASYAVDQAKAADCIGKLETLSCSLSGAELRAARTACFGALVGKLEIGQACNSPLECKPGTYCQPNDSTQPYGQPGKCVALVANGGNCGSQFTTASGNDEDQNYAEGVCSSRASGDTGLHCESYDYDNGDYFERSAWTCKPGVADGANCSATTWCATGICDAADYTCKDPLPLLQQRCSELIKTVP